MTPPTTAPTLTLRVLADVGDDVAGVEDELEGEGPEESCVVKQPNMSCDVELVSEISMVKLCGPGGAWARHKIPSDSSPSSDEGH